MAGSTLHPYPFSKYAIQIEYNVKVIILREEIYKFSLFFNREKKSFLAFHWYGRTILTIPENLLLCYMTHLQILAGRSVRRMRGMGHVACMGEMRCIQVFSFKT